MIDVHININGRPISKIYIVRESGGTKPDDLNIYSAEYVKNDDVKRRVVLGHRYGDGVEKLVTRVLSSLGFK